MKLTKLKKLMKLLKNIESDVSVLEINGEVRGSLWELKHLTYQRKRNQIRDSRSSGERTGNSPNPPTLFAH